MPGFVDNGVFSRPLKKLADLLSQSTTFQTLTGAANAAAALGYIWPYVIDAEEDGSGGDLPSQGIALAPGEGFERTLISMGGDFDTQGPLLAVFCFEVPGASSGEYAAQSWAHQQLETIMEEVEGLMGPSSMVIRRWGRPSVPIRSARSAANDTVQMAIEIEPMYDVGDW